MLRWFEYSQVYHPTRVWDAAPGDLGHQVEDVYFDSSDDVKLNAWFFRAKSDSPRAHFAFLVCHGNGGNISHRLGLAASLLRTGAAVMLFDYRGYGKSEGKLSEEGTYLDAQAAYKWLLEHGFVGEGVIAFGESLGGAVACELALRERVGGLVLQSAFTGIGALGAELFPWLPVHWLHSLKYDTLSKLPRIRVPVLVMHSKEDGLIKFHHAEKNFAAANEPKLFWETRGDHNYSLASDHERNIQGIEKFIAMLEKQ